LRIIIVSSRVAAYLALVAISNDLVVPTRVGVGPEGGWQTAQRAAVEALHHEHTDGA